MSEIPTKYTYVTPAASPVSSKSVSVLESSATVRKVRSQVSQACSNCQKACKKCEVQRPCPRCINRGWAESCIDLPRKVRRSGIPRGPYKNHHQNPDSSKRPAKRVVRQRSVKSAGNEVVEVKEVKNPQPPATLPNVKKPKQEKKEEVNDDNLFLLSAICAAALGEESSDDSISPVVLQPKPVRPTIKLTFKMPEAPTRNPTPPY